MWVYGLPRSRKVVVHRVCEGHVIIGCVDFHSDNSIKVTDSDVVLISYIYIDVETHAV